jgi:hypothetical protein
MRLVLIPWAMSGLKTLPDPQRLCRFFRFRPSTEVVRRDACGEIRHENANCRQTSGASQPLEREELQTHPVSPAGVGIEATFIGELVVVFRLPEAILLKFS